MAFVSDMTSTAAAPSLSGHELPAVTPPSPNASGSSESFSSVDEARGPSSLATSLPSWSVTGTISRSKKPSSCERDGELLRALRVLVHVGAADLVLLRHVDRGQTHVDVGVGLAVLADQVLVAVGGAGGLGALVEATDELDPGGDVGVALAGLDRVGGVADRVERRGAVARDRRAGDGLRKLLGEQRDDAGDVERLQALGHAAAAVDVLDQVGRDVRVALEQLVDDEGGGFLGAKLGEGSLERAPDRAAGGVDDHGFGHLVLRSLGSFGTGDGIDLGVNDEPTTGTALPPERVAELLGDGVAVIDVRRSYEFEAGHIPGARNIEMNELTARAEEISREQPVLFYCRSGGPLVDGRRRVPRVRLRRAQSRRRNRGLGGCGPDPRSRRRRDPRTPAAILSAA